MSKNTIYSEACYKVIGFQQMSEEFIQKLVINGKSESTHKNYIRQIAKLATYFQKLPLNIEIDELEEYLYFLIQRDTDALSSYKHLVYGLRKLYQLFGKEELELALPSINRPSKIPVVLSTAEAKIIFKTAIHIRERIMFALTYDTGLRIGELVNLQIKDVDLDRRMVHIRKTKNNKERYVPMSVHSVRGIKKQLAINSPQVYLFENIQRKGMPISKTRVRTLLSETMEMTNIKKNVTPHTFRHSYATHQLEAGQSIVVLKNLLGHANIQTTMIYLQTSQVEDKKKLGCLDYLYGSANA